MYLACSYVLVCMFIEILLGSVRKITLLPLLVTYIEMASWFSIHLRGVVRDLLDGVVGG